MCVSRSGRLQRISRSVIISGPGRVLGQVRLCVCVCLGVGGSSVSQGLSSSVALSSRRPASLVMSKSTSEPMNLITDTADASPDYNGRFPVHQSRIPDTVRIVAYNLVTVFKPHASYAMLFLLNSLMSHSCC